MIPIKKPIPKKIKPLTLESIKPLVKKPTIPELERVIWAAIKRHVKNGGFISNGLWGVSVRSKGVVKYDDLGDQSDCRCAIGCLFTPDNLNIPYCDKRGFNTWELSETLGRSLGEDTVGRKLLSLSYTEICNFICGFDGEKSDKTAKTAYIKLGQRIRQRAQKLPQWRGDLI